MTLEPPRSEPSGLPGYRATTSCRSAQLASPRPQAAMTSANDLAAGHTLSGFSFDSSLTLAQLESPSIGHPSDPVDTAFVYSGGPFSDAGLQIVAAPTAAVATPEPTTTLITAIGFGLIALCSGFLRW